MNYRVFQANLNTFHFQKSEIKSEIPKNKKANSPESYKIAQVSNFINENKCFSYSKFYKKIIIYADFSVKLMKKTN